MNYVQRNRRNIILICGGLLLFIVLILVGTQKMEYGSEDLVATVYPISLNVGEPLKFEDNSPFGKSRKWIFGDGAETPKKNGEHIYQKPGFYPVTLIVDNKFNKTFNVLVSAATAKDEVTDAVPTMIDAPMQAMQFENVFFRAVAENAKMFTWRFGESGNIDAKSQLATYAFKAPGSYVVTLYTDTDQEPITHQIKILPSHPELEEEVLAPPAPTETEGGNKMNDDFRYHLQQIANGSNFNFHYNYLRNTYLCGRDNVSVTANDKNNSFYYYCAGLQFDKNNLIQEVETTVDTGQNCVTKVEVKQSKQ